MSSNVKVEEEFLATDDAFRCNSNYTKLKAIYKSDMEMYRIISTTLFQCFKYLGWWEELGWKLLEEVKYL